MPRVRSIFCHRWRPLVAAPISTLDVFTLGDRSGRLAEWRDWRCARSGPGAGMDARGSLPAWRRRNATFTAGAYLNLK
jgi:hypothetical protein